MTERSQHPDTPDSPLDADTWRAAWRAGVREGIEDADKGRFVTEQDIAAVLGRYAKA
jgi:predicted transcriptional regulator